MNTCEDSVHLNGIVFKMAREKIGIPNALKLLEILGEMRTTKFAGSSELTSIIIEAL